MRMRMMINWEDVNRSELDAPKRKTCWYNYTETLTNNQLKYRGYPMARNSGKRKRMTKQEYKERNVLPFM